MAAVSLLPNQVMMMAGTIAARCHVKINTGYGHPRALLFEKVSISASAVYPTASAAAAAAMQRLNLVRVCWIAQRYVGPDANAFLLCPSDFR
ncbi:MAG: hypothetical protein Q9157_006616, partial [Trypethelium eluteriae]